MEQNPDVKNMVDYLLNRSTSYKKEKIVEDYLRSLKQFLKCVQKEPSEILDEADLDEKLSRRERKHPLKAYLYQYLSYLRTTNLTHNTIVWKVAHIRTFFRVNGFVLTGFNAPSPKIIAEPIRMDKQLAYDAFMSANTLRDRTVIHFLWGTGLSLIDVIRLNRDDVQELDGWGYVELYRQKSGNRFTAVIPPDCMISLNRYLRSRIDNNPALFINRSSKRISIKAIQHILSKLAKKMQLEHNGIHAHNFRKGNNKAWKLSGLPTEIVEFLHGRIMGVRSRYGDYSPQDVIETVKPYYECIKLL